MTPIRDSKARARISPCAIFVLIPDAPMTFLHTLTFLFLCLVRLDVIASVPSEQCSNATDAIIGNFTALVSDANSLDDILYNCTKVELGGSDLICVYNAPPDGSFESTCLDANGTYYEYSWTITCETTSRDVFEYQFNNIKECVSSDCTEVEADDEITTAIQDFEHEVENGGVHDIENGKGDLQK